MRLRKCFHCGCGYPNHLSLCPNCGEPPSVDFERKIWGSAAGVISLAFALIPAFADFSAEKKAAQTAAEVKIMETALAKVTNDCQDRTMLTDWSMPLVICHDSGRAFMFSDGRPSEVTHIFREKETVYGPGHP